MPEISLQLFSSPKRKILPNTFWAQVFHFDQLRQTWASLTHREVIETRQLKLSRSAWVLLYASARFASWDVKILCLFDGADFTLLYLQRTCVTPQICCICGDSFNCGAWNVRNVCPPLTCQLCSGMAGPFGRPGSIGLKGEKGDAGFTVQGPPGFPGVKGEIENETNHWSFQCT